MKVLFHTFTLNYRGTAVAVYDYAKYNEEVLGNESIICYCDAMPEKFLTERDIKTEQSVLDYVSKRFKVVSYTDVNQLQKICDTVDVAYFILYGHKESIPQVRSAVHAVFQAYEPFGTRYAYVSEWLANKMMAEHTTQWVPFVPHIVDLPEPNGDYKEKFNIPKNKTVVGRIGGYNSFDISFVKDKLINFVNKNDDYVFLMVNTEPFYKHPNIIYINSFVDRQKKSNFINTCDVMLHARMRGESFGLSVCEFLFHNKPVLAWEGGVDQNHVHLLKDTGLLYNENNFEEKLLTFKDYRNDYKYIVKQFEPKRVMQKFHDVFLS